MMTHRRAGFLALAATLSLWLAVCGLAAQEVVPSKAAGGKAVPVVPKVFTLPSLPLKTYVRYPWKQDIVATLFWVGEPLGGSPSHQNASSAWDVSWLASFGGVDDPDPARRTANFTPAAFVPKLNPFYVALPYSDVVDSSTTKDEAARIIPWFKQTFIKAGKSVCHNRWVAIRHGNRVCYAQWGDSGPFGFDDAGYVFGDKRPANTQNGGAGINVSPAVRDFLGMGSGAKCDWRFVELIEVPPGPWRAYGSNNPFIQSQGDERSELRGRLEELRKMRDEYFRANATGTVRPK